MAGFRSAPFDRSIPLAAAALAFGLAACAGDSESGVPAGEAPVEDAPAVAVAGVGLATPESVLHDPVADVYLVSNINGAPLDRDDNGFISRVAPDGSVEDLRWIDGEDEATRLHAPKGLAIRGDTLFVTDIDLVRLFHRVAGTYLGAFEVPGATFLNDLTVGADGTLYVSDMGVNPDFSPSGTAAIYRFEDGLAVKLSGDVAGPNGLVATDHGVVAVSFSGPTVSLIRPDGTMELMATLPGGQLDGIVRLADGSFLVSSWEAQAVYRIPADGGDVQAVLEGVPSPADIGWDARRQRVLIPVFLEDRLVFEPIR